MLLAGAAADDMGTQLGGWSITWQGGTGPVTPGTTLRGALEDRLGDRLRSTADGAFDAGTHAKVGIVVVAEPPYAEGNGDSATLLLPDDRARRHRPVRPLVDRLVVVVYSGRPMLLDRLADADAIVAAWLPGPRRQGIAASCSATDVHGHDALYVAAHADDAPRSARRPATARCSRSATG